MSVKTTPDQHQSNLRNVYGTFAIEGMTIRGCPMVKSLMNLSKPAYTVLNTARRL